MIKWEAKILWFANMQSIKLFTATYIPLTVQATMCVVEQCVRICHIVEPTWILIVQIVNMYISLYLTIQLIFSTQNDCMPGRQYN